MGTGQNIANASAASTTAGAPTPLSVGPQQNPAIGSNQPSSPPIGRPARHPVAPHNGKQSVGTHRSFDPAKQANPVYGQSK